jgi:hypothetical protein
MPAIALVAPILPIREIVRAMNFYRRLGFSAHAWQDGDTYALLHRNGQSVPLSRSESSSAARVRQPPASTSSMTPPALPEAELRAAGVEILLPFAPLPWEMKDFTVSDPDGNQIHFGEELS